MSFKFPDVFESLQVGDNVLFRLDTGGVVFHGTINEIDHDKRLLTIDHKPDRFLQDVENGWRGRTALISYDAIEACWPATQPVKLGGDFRLQKVPSEWMDRHDNGFH